MAIHIGRRDFIKLLGGAAAAWPCAARAQQPTMPVIGYLDERSPDSLESDAAELGAFRRGLSAAGYVEGRNVAIEYRSADGQHDRLPALATDLVRRRVSIIASFGVPATRAAKAATATIPIVFVIGGDPVQVGLVDSLSRPGGNLTGVTFLGSELQRKRLELLQEAVPKLSRVGVLDDASTDIQASFQDFEPAARALKIQLQSLEVRGPNPDLAGAFQAAAKGRVNALITVRTALLINYRRQIADLVIKNRLPSMWEGGDFVEAGGLMSYSSSDAEIFRRAATYVDKILKGAKPADLPVEQPTKFEFIINLKAAKQIGLTIPPNVLARADKVIR